MEPNDLGPLFRLPEDPHYLWIFGTALAAGAIAVLLVGLVRGRMPGFLILPALILPITSYAVGYLFTLEESKSVAFCGSCHTTMSPLVAALEEDNGSLSSAHWRIGAVSHQDACYQCHSGYGIWGQVDAKFAGVMHMVRTVTRDFEYPIESKHFDNGSCLGCHAQTVPFRDVEEHQDADTQQELLNGEASCAGLCHDDAHPESALWGVGGPPAGSGD